jgi:hypothetical protein
MLGKIYTLNTQQKEEKENKFDYNELFGPWGKAGLFLGDCLQVEKKENFIILRIASLKGITTLDLLNNNKN